MKIYAPVKDTNGVYASVRFVNGVGETDNPHLIHWFASHGFRIESQRVEQAATTLVGDAGTVNQPDLLQNQRIETAPITPAREPEMLEEVAQPDFDNMTPNELREWMKANGLGMQMKNIRNKEKLLEIIRR